MNEIWKDIIGYEGLYQISNFGNIKSIIRKGSKGSIRRLQLTKSGYYDINLWKDGISNRFRVHRLVYEAFNNIKPEIVDHIDGNKSNNRLSNLRSATISQNKANSLKKENTSSRFKGVCYNKRKNKWQVSICPNNKNIHVGYFDNEKDAGRAYDAKAIEFYGEFAKTNEMLGLYIG